MQVTGGSKLDPQSVVCHFLGYEMGAGNYKVQNINTQCVYVSCHVIFEEGQPHHTSMSVGEKMIPLFDTLDIHDAPDATINPDRTITDPAVIPKL